MKPLAPSPMLEAVLSMPGGRALGMLEVYWHFGEYMAASSDSPDSQYNPSATREKLHTPFSSNIYTSKNCI